MDDVVDNVIESNHYCWGDGRCNQFMNSTKYGNDGGDCLRKIATFSKCNNLDCCDDEKARTDEICEKRNCDCEKQDLSGFCKDFCCEDVYWSIRNLWCTDVIDAVDIRNGVSSGITSLAVIVSVQILIQI